MVRKDADEAKAGVVGEQEVRVHVELAKEPAKTALIFHLDEATSVTQLDLALMPPQELCDKLFKEAVHVEHEGNLGNASGSEIQRRALEQQAAYLTPATSQPILMRVSMAALLACGSSH